MGFGKFFIFAALVGVAAYFATTKFCCSGKLDLPDFTQARYWGQKVVKGNAIPADNEKIRKFEVKFAPEVIEDLRDRLLQTKYLEPLEGATFEYGFNPNQLKKVVNYWLNKYNFNQTEKELNKYPQFVTQIEGIDVHFIHIKPAKPRYSKPLVLVHGWPGSVYEYYKVANLLKNDFELIIPSIPGYGFSERPHKQGFTVGDAARIFVKLLKRLGHEKFYYHGGDWGSFIGQYTALFFPNNVEGLHITMVPAKYNFRTIAKLLIGRVAPNIVYSSKQEEQLADKACPFKQFFSILEESGYMHLQSTKPDTIGSLLVDSPAGLAAYILEKFSVWVNEDYIKLEDGGLTKKLTMDELLTNVMIYWVGGNSGYSVRFYKENIPTLLKKGHKMPLIPKQVAFGHTVYPNELFARFPRFFVEEVAENLVYYSIAERGSHFGGFEEPQITANEIRNFADAVVKQQQEQQKKPETVQN